MIPKPLLNLLPTSVEIAGKHYKIEYKLRLYDSEGKLHGDACDEEYTIRINLAQPPIMKETLFHEIIHAILAQTGYNFILKDLSPSFEEGLVRNLEVNLGRIVDFPDEFWPDAKIQDEFSKNKSKLEEYL